jgi:hypothetical protein
MLKLRAALVFFNARRFGFDVEQALRCATEWERLFRTHFLQSAASRVYEGSSVRLEGFEGSTLGQSMFIGAHFSAYTICAIALGRHYRTPVNIVVGTPSRLFIDTLKRSMSESNVSSNVITSGFSMLRQIKQAKERAEPILTLFDVPWRRVKDQSRDFLQLPFGNGKIMASTAMFDLARRRGMRPEFILCEPEPDGFVIRNYGAVRQEECFEILQTAVKANPAHYERFCELHGYYVDGGISEEVVSFEMKDRFFLMSAKANRSWRLGRLAGERLRQHLASEDRDQADAYVDELLARVTDMHHRKVVHL